MTRDTMRALLAPKMTSYDPPRTYAKRLRWRRKRDAAQLWSEALLVGAALILGACVAVVALGMAGVC